jgi:predicted metal-dependent hydrolase
VGRIVIDNIDMQVERKHIKNMYIRVIPPDGKVKIAAPVLFPDEKIRAFAVSKIPWIKKRRAILANKPRPVVQQFVDGETLPLLGKQYPLLVRHGAVNTVFFKNDHILLQIRNNTPRERRAKIIEEWYRDILKKIVPGIMQKWEKAIGVKTAEWKIQNMRTKWGTCNISARRIVLNLQLAKKAPEYLEYVIIHELLHLLEKAHNAKFKKHMDAFCPGWRRLRKTLR